MAYELITKTGGRVGSPAISVVPGGRIALNAASAKVLSTAKAKAVFILWDPATSKMAMKPAEKGAKNSFAVSLAPNLNSGSIRARAAMLVIGWDPTQRELFPAVWNESEKMLEADLSRLIPKSAKARAK